MKSWVDWGRGLIRGACVLRVFAGGGIGCRVLSGEGLFWVLGLSAGWGLCWWGVMRGWVLASDSFFGGNINVGLMNGKFKVFQQLVRKLVYAKFISNNHVSFHLW